MAKIQIDKSIQAQISVDLTGKELEAIRIFVSGASKQIVRDAMLNSGLYYKPEAEQLVDNFLLDLHNHLKAS